MSMTASRPIPEHPIAALSAHRDEILARWVDATRALPFHQHNTEQAFTDHMPRLLDAYLRSLEGEIGADEQGQEAALAHATVRTAQGLSASDMVTEFGLLRGQVQRVLGTCAGEDVQVVLALEARVHEKLDRLIATALQAFDRQNRLEDERDEFVSRASHELKTPLTSATGLLQLARRRLARQEEDPLGLGPMLETAQKQVDRLATLVDDLRNVSQLRSGQLRLHTGDLDLRELLAASARSMQATTRQHVLHLQENGDALRVHGDAARLSHLLDCLLGNAIKFSPDGGDVWIRAAREEGHAVVEIEDNGIGVPDQDRGMLFAPFRRASNADRAATGMGLGLYISRELARQHGGDLELARSGPEGSTFRLTLPLIAEITETTEATTEQ